MTTFAKKSILSTADVARLFNVTETTVKRWADEGTLRCQKTPGGHRKFEVRNVVDFAEVNHFDPVGTLEIPEADRLAQRIQVATLGRDFSELVAAYVEKALAPDSSGLFPFVSYLYQHRVQLWEMYDLVIRPGMMEIGERFARGEIGVNHEHRASYETLNALAKLQAQIHIKPPAGRSVVCACVGEDLHEIGLRCASYIFEAEGWMVVYLGARIPAGAVRAALREVKPDLACLSVTQPVAGESPVQALVEITRGAREIGCRVILGGRVAASLFLPPGSVDAVHDSARGLLDYIATYNRVAVALKTV